MSTFKVWVAALALAVFGVACGPSDPPEYVSYDSDFSESERETLRAAVAAWCESPVAWCPVEALWSERGRFVLVDTLGTSNAAECPEGLTCIVSGRNTGDVVKVARDRAAPEDLAVLYTVAVHEVGHYCADHTRTGVMAALQKADNGALGVDDSAVRAWRAGCN